jgi:subtilisin family serine protease
MRARSAHIPALHLAAVIVSLLASSCSREVPTALSSRAPARADLQRFSSSAVSGEVVITLAPGADAATVAASYGATLVHDDAAQSVACLSPSAGGTVANLMANLSTDPRVSSSEANALLQTAESRQQSFAFDDGLCTPATYVEQPTTQALHLLDAHNTATGVGVRIAILDTGIDPNHPALQGHVVAAHDFVLERAGATEVAQGVDTNGDGVVDGAWGHGTHLSGIVLLTAPDAQLIVGRVLDSDGVGDVVTVAAGIRWAISQGANIINLSLGTLQSSEAISTAIMDAKEHGVIVTVSAGNWGAEFPQEYPASDPRVITVAASDAFGAPAPWTSYASYIRLSAPGMGVRSTYPGGEYRLWSGTSMSAPFVAGTVALLLQMHPYWTQADYLDRLRTTASPLNSLSAAQSGKLGAGMLDVGAALKADAAPGGEDEELRTPTHR